MTHSIPNLLHPSTHILVAGKLDADSIIQAKAEGVAHIIDLLPDTEHAGFDEAAASKVLGIRYSNLPIFGAADLTRENITAFDRLLDDPAQPVTLVHCASGNRVGALFALRAGWLQKLPFSQALQIGRNHGLTKLEPVVAQLLMASG